jgi:methionine-gamma-lyase
LVGGYDTATAFIEALRLITHAVSLGGIDSLAQHPASLTHRPVIASARPGGGIVRLSIGLENVDDLMTDITDALDFASHAQRAARAAQAPSRA